jgi:hypothetical protein
MSDAQLTEALQAAAEAEAAVQTGPLAEPVPMQSSVPNKAAPELKVVESAVGDGVTVESDETPLTFEEAYLQETLGIEPDAGDEDEAVTEPSDPGAQLTPDQQRIAELEAQIAEVEAAKIVDAANAQWVNKWQEGKTYFENLEDQVREIGARDGRSEVEIERAVNRVLTDESDWDRRFFLAREVGIRESERAARGVDVISTLIKEAGLTNADRPKLAQFATNPDVMKAVAAMIKSERDAVASRDSKIKSKATKNVAEQMSRQAIVPAGPTTGRRETMKVTGSDSELDFMVKNRPTRLRQVQSA